MKNASFRPLRADRDKMCEALAYESPIEAIISEASNKFDDGVFKAVLSTGIKVDKEELIKALKYDRGQYNKGYAVGVKEFARRLKEEMSLEDDCDYNCRKCCFECKDYVIVIDNLLKEMVGEEE